MSVSRDYDKFNLLEYNRNLDRIQINKLKESISKHGYLQSNPIIVDEDMNIVDGQHRFMACKEMGKPIFYEVIDDSTNLIIDLNTTQKKWGMKDYVNYYASKDRNGHYVRFREVQKACKVSYDIIVAIAYGKATSGSISREIREGKLIFTQEDAERTLEILGRIKLASKYLRIKTTGRFTAALMIISKNDNFRWEKMLTQCYKYSTVAYPCRTTDEYIRMFTDLYNYMSREKTKI